MLVYNITFHVEPGIDEEVLSFLRKKYIPEAGKTGILKAPRFCKVRNAYSEEGHNYSIQFYVESEALLDTWKKDTGRALLAEISDLFKTGTVGFETLMDELDT